MRKDRREFLVASGAALAHLAIKPLQAFSAPPIRDQILSPSMQLAADGKSTTFSIANLATGKVESFTLPLTLAHSWAENPHRAGTGVVPESGGAAFSLVDVARKKVLKTVRTGEKDIFWGGHAAYTSDGKQLVLSRFNATNGLGSISIRSADTGEEQRQFPSHGLFPHELYIKDGGKSVLVANLGFDPKNGAQESVNLTSVDFSTGKVSDVNVVRPDPKLVQANSKLIPENLWGEASYFLQVGDLIASRPRKVGLVLHPHARALSIWRTQKPYELIRFLDFSPLQIVAFSWLSNRTHLAISLSDNTLRFYKKGFWEEDASIPKIAAFRSSTHIFASGGDM